MRITVLLLLLCLTAGCKRTDVEKHPLMKRAEDCRLEGDFQGAANGYKRLLEKYPDNPKLHLKLASLCDESLNRPDGAIFHYEEYLALTPENSPDRQEIIAYRDAARQRLIDSVKPQDNKLEELEKENQALRNRIEELKKHLFAMQKRQRISTPAPVQIPAIQPEIPSVQPTASEDGEATVYIVKSGDTPGKIARQFYGAASKYYLIMQANNLTASRSLRIGQKLKIPKEKK